jgi:hypothetical protein
VTEVSPSQSGLEDVLGPTPEGRLPEAARLAVDGRRVLEQVPITPFGELLPALHQIAHETIGYGTTVSSRLWNVLRQWHGTEWAGYLEVTPGQLIGRRNCGVRSLGEFLWLARTGTKLANRRATPEPSGAESRPTPHAETPDATSNGGVIADKALVADALWTILGWAVYERGAPSFRTAVDLAFDASDPPREVAIAVSRIGRRDLDELVHADGQLFDVVGAIESLEVSLSERDRLVASRRLLAIGRPATLDEVGVDLGVTRERVRQMAKRLGVRLRLSGRPGSALGRTARSLHESAGNAVPAAWAHRHVAPLRGLADAPVDAFAMRLLLFLAGPYQLVGEWLVRRPSGATIATCHSALQALTADGPASIKVAIAALESVGIRQDYALDWILTMRGWRVDEDLLIPWRGGLGDKAEIVLRLSSEPLSLEELMTRIAEPRSPSSFRNCLMSDPRFKRTGLRQYGLAEWEHDEYTGIADEIAQEIEAQGGAASLEHLCRELSARYGVAAASVRAYALGPRFRQETGGLIRIASSGETWHGGKSIESTRGAYLRAGHWIYRTTVSEEMLRGSGFGLPAPVARAFGLEPPGSLELRFGGSPFRINWTGPIPTAGSIRPALQVLGAAVGDRVIIGVSDGELDLRLVAGRTLPAASGPSALAAELGLGVDCEDPLAAVAEALRLASGASEAAIRGRLIARGEHDLAGLLPELESDELVLNSAQGRFVEVRWSL